MTMTQRRGSKHRVRRARPKAAPYQRLYVTGASRPKEVPGAARPRFGFLTSNRLMGIEATSSGFIMRALTATLSLRFTLMRA
jgi:hypothetical protein